MKQIDLATGKETVLLPEDTVSCAIGNFDGVHLGHRKLISLSAKRPHGASKSAVWTFTEPSSHFLNGKLGLLSTMEERLSLFRSLGIDIAFIEDFEKVRDMDADRFAKEILYTSCHVRTAVCGFNFRYGKNAAGTSESLSQAFRSLGAFAVILPPFQIGDVTVSSSEIRAALASGNAETAAAMLGRPYSLTGEVIMGKKLGHTLGFPTANQRFPEMRMIPRFGVYAVRAVIAGYTYPGVANVGVRPTVENTGNVNCETHILHFDGDLYGKTIRVEFCKFLHPEKKFENPHALRDAVMRNIEEAAEYFRQEPEYGI